MRLEHHLVGGYVRYISPYIIIIIIMQKPIFYNKLFTGIDFRDQQIFETLLVQEETKTTGSLDPDLDLHKCGLESKTSL